MTLLQPELVTRPILRSWAKRAKAGKPTYERHIRLLSKVNPTDAMYKALGGDVMRDWLRQYVREPVTEPPGYTFDVLGIPYYGPKNNRDDDGQYFDEDTEFYDGVLDLPPLSYVHGRDTREPVGRTLDRWYDDRGVWFKAWLDPTSQYYDQLVTAHKERRLYASSGVVPAFYDFDQATGHITHWLAGEIAMVDIGSGYAPKNRFAVTKADVDDVLMHDYYGDPVVEKKSMWEQLRILINSFRTGLDVIEQDIVKANEAVVEPVKAVEEEIVVEKCTTCDQEAERLAQEAETELLAMKADAEKAKECIPCRNAVSWAMEMVKANKVDIDEGLKLIKQFRVSADGFPEMKAAIEARDNTIVTAIQKAGNDAGISVAGGQGMTHAQQQEIVDEAFVQKQLQIAGVAGSGYMERK